MSIPYAIQDLTLDLFSKVVAYLDEGDCRCFALVNEWHLLVYKTATDWSSIAAATSTTSTIPTIPLPAAAAAGGGPCPSSFSLPETKHINYIDRPRFLRPGEAKECAALVSYPRSGNSMLRDLLERVTGIVTGSDTRPDRVLSRSLLRKGLRGEGVVDDRTWIVKTHWPERYGYKRFTAQRVILLVRNPFDAINSYFNMGMTNTHDKTLIDDLYVSLGNIWEDLVRNEVKIWSKFNHYWLTRGVPVLAVRYEDLLLHTEEMLVRLVSFTGGLNPEAVRASAAYMDRINIAAAAVKGGNQRATGSDPLSSNRPRGGGKIGGSLRHYSPAQIEETIKEEGRSLRAFGYDPESQGFPNRLLTMPPYERCVKHMDCVGVSVTVNKGRQIRDSDDKYGRSITKVRHDLTDHDRVPLPTVATKK